MGDSDKWLYGKEEGVSGRALSCLEAGREQQECG